MREGDYLNIGAGSEVGIYSRPDWLTQDPKGLDHYFTDYGLSVPMTLSLYNYGGGIENIFHWYPKNNQWWITGFNPKHVGTVDVHKQVMVGSVDFSGRADFYKEFKEEMDLEENKAKREYLFFDDIHNTIWIMLEDI